MKRIFIYFFIVYLFYSCKNEKTILQSEKSTALSQKLDSIGQSIIDSQKILGLSVAIMKGNDTIYNQGFGYTNIERTQPVTNDTRFLMASVSKLIGSTIVMKLVDEGKLSLHQTLEELLPDYPDPEQARKITLKNLISHTSGLQEYATVIDSAYIKTGIAPTKEDVYDFLKNRELLFEPNTDWSYCNTGFYLMMLIVERITNKPFQNEIDRVINKPTGMDLKLIAQATNDPNMSSYWEYKNTNTFVPYPHWTWIKGDGGITATSIMLAQFPRLWANGKIINQQSFETMICPIVLNNGIETGYGIGVRNGEFIGDRIIGHTGGNKSTYAIMVYLPAKDLSFVCFINTDNSPTSIRKVFAEFASAVLKKKTPDYRNQEVPTQDLSVYAGTYRNFDKKMENVALIKLNEVDGHLYYCIKDDCLKMYSLGQHNFWIEEWPNDLVSFHVNENGKSIGLKEYYTGFYSVLRLNMYQ